MRHIFQKNILADQIKKVFVRGNKRNVGMWRHLRYSAAGNPVSLLWKGSGVSQFPPEVQASNVSENFHSFTTKVQMWKLIFLSHKLSNFKSVREEMWRTSCWADGEEQELNHQSIVQEQWCQDCFSTWKLYLYAFVQQWSLGFMNKLRFLFIQAKRNDWFKVAGRLMLVFVFHLK